MSIIAVVVGHCVHGADHRTGAAADPSIAPLLGESQGVAEAAAATIRPATSASLGGKVRAAPAARALKSMQHNLVIISNTPSRSSQLASALGELEPRHEDATPAACISRACKIEQAATAVNQTTPWKRCEQCGGDSPRCREPSAAPRWSAEQSQGTVSSIERIGRKNVTNTRRRSKIWRRRFMGSAKRWM
ncbi:hypothetical protein ACXX9E_29760 [Pseudomonas sp. GNP014]